jgi:hypothetical protein
MSDKPEKRFAARGFDRVWHWLSVFDPHLSHPKCGGAPFEFRRVIVPAPDFKIDLDHGDILCPACNALPGGEWYGLVTAKVQATLDLASSGLRIVKPCPFCQGRILPLTEWATGTWCCEDQFRKSGPM